MSCQYCQVKRPKQSEADKIAKHCDECGKRLKIVSKKNGKCKHCGDDVIDFFLECPDKKGPFAESNENHDYYCL